MKIEGLTRQGKENLYSEKAARLQRMREHPIDEDAWGNPKEWDENELDKRVKGAIRQVRLEKGRQMIGKCFLIICLAICLGNAITFYESYPDKKTLSPFVLLVALMLALCNKLWRSYDSLNRRLERIETGMLRIDKKVKR